MIPVIDPTGKTKYNASLCPNSFSSVSCASGNCSTPNNGNATVTNGNNVQSSTHKNDAKFDSDRNRPNNSFFCCCSSCCGCGGGFRTADASLALAIPGISKYEAIFSESESFVVDSMRAAAEGSGDDEEEDDDGVDAPLIPSTPLMPKPLTPPVGVGSGEEDDDGDDEKRGWCGSDDDDDDGCDSVLAMNGVNCGANADTSPTRFEDRKPTSCTEDTEKIIVITIVVDDCFITIFVVEIIIL
mmetsp:Transcript_28194/g.68577  ORF Transcript_28194/g.68577 Transcript_28194/m.68577 type:complete len:242 (+) Transcript_28194:472-1197(+)